MCSGFPLFPEQASTMAGSVDALYFFLVAITAFFSIAISRRRPRTSRSGTAAARADERPAEIHGSLAARAHLDVIPLR